MPSGSCTAIAELPREAERVLAEARRAVLSTVGVDGVPHSVPICFAIKGADIVTAVDDKPKADRRLARLTNIERSAVATVLFDRWDEDWTRLAWVMVRGGARVEQAGSADAELAIRYSQYRDDPPPGEVIAVRPDRIRWWTWG